MATHLSVTLSPLENLDLVAQGITMTKRYGEIYEEMVRQELPAKINTLKISTLAMGIVSLVVTIWVNKKAGIILACSTAIPLVGLYYQNQRKNVFLSKLEETSNEARAIFSQMIDYLDSERVFKETVLIREFNSKKTSYYSKHSMPEVENELWEIVRVVKNMRELDFMWTLFWL